jgi:hypothetical protein
MTSKKKSNMRGYKIDDAYADFWIFSEEHSLFPVVRNTAESTIKKFELKKLLIPLMILTLMIAGTVYAVHMNGLFQLDGNTFDDNGGDDWANIFDPGTYGASSANVSQFVYDDNEDGSDLAHEINYLGGGSKDDLDIPNWEWDTSPVPDKNDIMTAGAALYMDGGDTYIYFFLDRFSSGTGDANVAFWFFQNEHGLVPSESDPSKGTFEGVHAIGDILVLSEFTIGGGVSTVKVFEWVGDNDGNELTTVVPAPGTGDSCMRVWTALTLTQEILPAQR